MASVLESASAADRTPFVELGELMSRKPGSINPAKRKDQIFELYSIPAYETREPEIQIGSTIGSSKQLVQPDDVLVSKIVPHIRRAWVVGPKGRHEQIASGEWIPFRSDRVEPNYLRHLLISDWFHPRFMQTVSGVGGSLLRARPAEVAKIKVPLPPLPEQRRIAAILDKADALRQKRRAAIAKLDQLLQSVFLEMFGDPVTNSKDWPTALISDLCKLVRGSSPRPKGDPRYYGGPVPRLMVADLTRDGWFVESQIDSLTEAGAEKSRPVPAGTLVMAVSGNVGLVSRLRIKACIHDGFVGFTNLDVARVKPNVLMLTLHFLKQTHYRITAGAIFQNLTTADIKNMPIPLPPIEVQEKLEAIFESWQRSVNAGRSAEDQTEALFRSLQQRAFTGQL